LKFFKENRGTILFFVAMTLLIYCSRHLSKKRESEKQRETERIERLSQMPKIYPFKGLRYNNKKIKRPETVLTPPYDVISKTEQAKLYKKHLLFPWRHRE